MADSNTQLHWTDEQWNKVRQVVYEEARKARVAGNFLPLYGPLEPDATNVSKEQLRYEDVPTGSEALARISVNNTETQPLLTLQVLVPLRSAQVADPELTSALTAFRRAANVLSRVEDTVIFNGKPSEEDLQEAREQKKSGTGTPKSAAAGRLVSLPQIWNVTGPDTADGLLDKADDLPPNLMWTQKKTRPAHSSVIYRAPSVSSKLEVTSGRLPVCSDTENSRSRRRPIKGRSSYRRTASCRSWVAARCCEHRRSTMTLGSSSPQAERRSISWWPPTFRWPFSRSPSNLGSCSASTRRSHSALRRSIRSYGSDRREPDGSPAAAVIARGA